MVIASSWRRLVASLVDGLIVTATLFFSCP
jgi:hypothetical protein